MAPTESGREQGARRRGCPRGLGGGTRRETLAVRGEPGASGRASRSGPGRAGVSRRPRAGSGRRVRAQGPRAPRGAVPAERREARPRQGPARGFPAGHRTPVQTAEASAAVQPRPRPAAGAAMGAVPSPGPAPAPLRPFQPRSPARDPGTVGVPPPTAGLALLGGPGPGEVSSAPLDLSPVCFAGARSPQGAGWRVVWVPSPGQ